MSVPVKQTSWGYRSQWRLAIPICRGYTHSEITSMPETGAPGSRYTANAVISGAYLFAWPCRGRYA